MNSDRIIQRINEIRNRKIKEPVPNPGFEVACFIAWLKKRGYCQSFTKCKKKCNQLNLDLDEDILKPLGKDIIQVYLSRGERVVLLKDKTWSQDLSEYHGVDIPHHRHHQPM